MLDGEGSWDSLLDGHDSWGDATAWLQGAMGLISKVVDAPFVVPVALNVFFLTLWMTQRR